MESLINQGLNEKRSTPMNGVLLAFGQCLVFSFINRFPPYLMFTESVTVCIHSDTGLEMT